MSNDYFKAQGWFKNYATSSEDSRGLFQQLAKEDEEAFRLASAESDRIKAMMNEKYGPGTIKYGSEIPQPEIKTPQAVFEFSQRNPAAEGGRIPFSEAGFVDKANNVKIGQDLGKGITQRLRNGKIKYSVGSFGSKEKMKELKLTFPEFTTLKEATDRRLMLVEKYGEPGGPRPDKIKFDYKKLVEQDPEFETFFKQEIKESKALQAIIKKYNLDENNLEEIWDKTRDETRRSEKIRKGGLPGEKQLISGATFDKLTKKFELTYKANKGTINSTEMGKLLNLSEGELSKIMSHIDKPYPDSKTSNTPLVSRIDKANTLKNILENEGITYERTNRGGEKVNPDLGQYRFKVDENKFKELSESDTFGFEKKQPPVTQKMSDMYTGLSKASDDYQKFGYDKDSGAIRTLTKSLNNSLKAMNDKQLLKFIENNPKLNNLVTLEFNPKDPKMFKNQDLRKMDINIVRQNVNFEADHIRGKRTVGYDAATKKITDGLDLAYPKNLYIIPKGLNAGVKQRVENYVAENIKNPKMKKEIKLIDDYFKTNKISYWNRTTKKYGGSTPIETGTGLGQIGIEDKESLKKILTGKYVNTKGETKFIADNPDKLIESVNELNRTKVAMNYIEGKTDFIGVSSGFNTDLISEDLKKIMDTEGFKTFKANIADPALEAAGKAVKVGSKVAALPTKVFGGLDLVLGYLDYTNNRQKGFSKADSTKHMVDAVLFGATSFGKEADIAGVREIANKNGMSNEVFDNLMAVNTNQKKFMDTVSKSKAEFNESMDIIESGAADPTAENMLIQKLKVDTKKSLTNTMKNIVDDSRSLETNLQVQEAGAPININVNKEKAFSDLGSSSREFVQNRIDASDLENIANQKDTTKGGIGDAAMSGLKAMYTQPKFIYDLINPLSPLPKPKDFFPKDLNYKSKMEQLKKEDPTMYYKMLMSEGVDPRINLNIPVQLEFERNNPEFGSQYTDSLTQNKAEGGIIGLRSKYEYKK